MSFSFFHAFNTIQMIYLFQIFTLTGKFILSISVMKENFQNFCPPFEQIFEKSFTNCCIQCSKLCMTNVQNKAFIAKSKF